MKTCPICEAVTFDDASVCFGCLHRYDEDLSGGAVHGDGAPVCFGFAHRVEEVPASAQSPSDDEPPAFFIKMAPVRERGGAVSWKCSVELAAVG